MLPRSTTTNFGKSQGKDEVTKIVRAASKYGAIVTARVDAISEIPIRSQQVGMVQSKETERFLNKWEVRIRDTRDFENVGR